jgi:hypothetical protein
MNPQIIDTETDFALQYAQIRRYTEQQCEALTLEDYVPQPVMYISPPKWHLAHTTWFSRSLS